MPIKIKNLYTCPKCRHPVGWWRKLNAGIFSQWPCKNCGTLLKVTYWKSMIFVSIFVLLVYLWLNPQRTILDINLFVIGLIIGVHLIKMFIIPIVEKGASQKSDAE